MNEFLYYYLCLARQSGVRLSQLFLTFSLSNELHRVADSLSAIMWLLTGEGLKQASIHILLAPRRESGSER